LTLRDSSQRQQRHALRPPVAPVRPVMSTLS
jgi:hypothetical protein